MAKGRLNRMSETDFEGAAILPLLYPLAASGAAGLTIRHANLVLKWFEPKNGSLANDGCCHAESPSRRQATFQARNSQPLPDLDLARPAENFLFFTRNCSTENVNPPHQKDMRKRLGLAFFASASPTQRGPLALGYRTVCRAHSPHLGFT